MVFAPHEDDQGVVDVLLVTENPLLGDVLEAVLLPESRLQLHRVNYRTQPGLVQEMDRYHPQIIIVEEVMFSDELYEKTRQMRGNGRLQLIVISADHNEILIFQSYRFTPANVAELTNRITAFIYDSGASNQLE